MTIGIEILLRKLHLPNHKAGYRSSVLFHSLLLLSALQTFACVTASSKNPMRSASEPHCFFQLIAGNSFIIVGAVAIGAAIQSAPGLCHNLKMLFIGYVIASLEHHVFEEMSKT